MRVELINQLGAQVGDNGLPPLFSPKRRSRSAKKPTASRFEPGVRSCCQTTVCGESSCLHQNQLDWAQKAICLA